MYSGWLVDYGDVYVRPCGISCSLRTLFDSSLYVFWMMGSFSLLRHIAIEPFLVNLDRKYCKRAGIEFGDFESLVEEYRMRCAMIEFSERMSPAWEPRHTGYSIEPNFYVDLNVRGLDEQKSASAEFVNAYIRRKHTEDLNLKFKAYIGRWLGLTVPEKMRSTNGFL